MVFDKKKILNAGAITVSYFILNKDSIILNCDANVGHIAKLFSLTGARVIVFEPDPIAVERLLKKCGGKKNITCLQKGGMG